MNWPSLSVIIPSYNQGKYIERTLLSILRQNYQGDLQIIVSDGGSTDETVEVLKKYPELIWWSERDKGFVDAVNKALTVANGDIIAIQSSDDFYLEGAFAKALSVLAEEPEIGLISGSQVRVNEDGETYSLHAEPYVSVFSPGAHLIRSCISQHCAFARRSAVEHVGGVRQEVDRCADYDLWYRLLHFYKARILPDYLGVCQVHSTQRTQQQGDLWYESLCHVVESCENDSNYATRYAPPSDLKREIFKKWQLHWLREAGGEEGAERSRVLARQVLASSEDWSEEMRIYAAPFADAPSSISASYPLSHQALRAIKTNSFLRAILKKPAVNSQHMPPSPNVNINWWKG